MSAAETPTVGGPDTNAELAKLRAERDRAVQTLDQQGRRTRRRARTRRAVTGALVVVFAVLLPLAATSAWAHRTVLDTGTYVSTVSPIAQDPVVIAALSREITNELYATLDPEATVAAALPPKAAFLAGPITNGTRGYVENAVNRVLSSDQFQQLWVTANRFAHAQLVTVLRKDGQALQLTDGQVTLNLVPLLDAALQNVQDFASSVVGHPVTVPTIAGNELPSESCARIAAALSRPVRPTCGQVVLFPAAHLAQARRAVRIFDRAVLALLILTPIVFAAALWASRRRRRTLLQLAVGGMLGLVIARRSVMWLQSDLIATGRPANKDARAAIVHEVLNGYFALTSWLLVAAAAIAVVALVTGPFSWAVAGRSWVRRSGGALIGAVSGGVSAAHDDTAVAFVRRHVDALRIAGVAVAALLLLVLDITFWGLLVVVALLAAYELWLHRLRPPTSVTLPDAEGLPRGIPQQPSVAATTRTEGNSTRP